MRSSLANEVHSSPQDFKVRQITFRTPTKTLFSVSRSINPEYPNIDKLQDVTRYNSYAYNVTHYRNYPNRLGTPKKPNRAQTSRLNERMTVSPKLNQLKTLITCSSPIGYEVGRSLLKSVMSSPMTLRPVEPRIVRFSSGRASYVMNDYHARETNQGYSRNHQFGGGFYTH
jgi:hypothetical protein